VIGDPDLPAKEGFRSNAERVANRPAVDGLCGEVFAKRDREANIELLKEAGVAYGRLSDLDDFANHPQNRFIEIRTEHGEIELLAPAAVIRGREERYGAVPVKDEQGQALREEFGASKLVRVSAD
jgi:crotonobetainyl-CoA:carnitine CoA-transferase CaiB-like acyl-CoA transferase